MRSVSASSCSATRRSPTGWFATNRSCSHASIAGRRWRQLELGLQLPLRRPDGLQVHHRQRLRHQRDVGVRRRAGRRPARSPSASASAPPPGRPGPPRAPPGPRTSGRPGGAGPPDSRPGPPGRRRPAPPRRTTRGRRRPALVLPALVDRQHLVPGRGDRRQHRDEVLLGPGVPGHQQHRGPGRGVGAGSARSAASGPAGVSSVWPARRRQLEERRRAHARNATGRARDTAGGRDGHNGAREPDHRRREPEGRRRQDDHRRLAGRRPGRARAARCCSSTSTRSPA